MTERENLLSVGLVTDMHYAPRTYGNRYCSESLQKLEDCITTFSDRQLDLIIHLGDAIDTGESVDEEKSDAREIRRCLEELGIPLLYVIGNHDIASLTKRQYLQACNVHDEKTYYSLDHHGVHIVVLDSNFHRDGSDFAAGNFAWDDAWLGQSQIDWLRHDLSSTTAETTLVFCHGNLEYREYQGEIDPHVVRDAEKVRPILEDISTSITVVQGHYHPGTFALQNGIPYITLRAMVEGSGLENNAYAVLSTDHNGAISLEGYGRQTSWSTSGQA